MKDFFNTLISLFTAIWTVICSFLPFGSIRITVEPSVFDCGNDYYCVVWETSTKGSGYVKYTFDGVEKTVWDASSGTISTDDTVHTVLVEKTELQGNTYKVGSQYVGFKYGYNAIKGKTVESPVYSFCGIPKDDDIKILSISDIHGMEDEMFDSLKYFSDTPDLLVLLGDITSEMTSKDMFTQYLLRDAAALSKSSIPIIYVRGNHETRGEFAAQMIDYLPTETDEFYYTFSFGSMSAVVLDSGEDKEDSHEGYDGLIDFNTYREKQYNWLCSLDSAEFEGSRYKLAFSHMPGIHDHFGKDWTVPLTELGMDLLVSGHSHKSAFIEDRALPVFIDCGKDTTEIWAASMLTLKDDTIHMLTIDNSGNTLLDKTISV